MPRTDPIDPGYAYAIVRVQARPSGGLAPGFRLLAGTRPSRLLRVRDMRRVALRARDCLLELWPELELCVAEALPLAVSLTW